MLEPDPARRSCVVQPLGADTLSAWRVQRSMAAGSGSPRSRTHTVPLAYWKVSTAVAGAPHPGWAHRRGAPLLGRNIRSTVPADLRAGADGRARYRTGTAYHCGRDSATPRSARRAPGAAAGRAQASGHRHELAAA